MTIVSVTASDTADSVIEIKTPRVVDMMGVSHPRQLQDIGCLNFDCGRNFGDVDGVLWIMEWHT